MLPTEQNANINAAKCFFSWWPYTKIEKRGKINPDYPGARVSTGFEKKTVSLSRAPGLDVRFCWFTIFLATRSEVVLFALPGHVPFPLFFRQSSIFICITKNAYFFTLLLLIVDMPDNNMPVVCRYPIKSTLPADAPVYRPLFSHNVHHYKSQ